MRQTVQKASPLALGQGIVAHLAKGLPSAQAVADVVGLHDVADVLTVGIVVRAVASGQPDWVVSPTEPAYHLVATAYHLRRSGYHLPMNDPICQSGSASIGKRAVDLNLIYHPVR